MVFSAQEGAWEKPPFISGSCATGDLMQLAPKQGKFPSQAQTAAQACHSFFA